MVDYDERYTERYERFLDIATTAAELARRLNKMQHSCNFTGSSKKAMATCYAEQTLMGRPARFGPVITDTMIDTLLTAYGRKSQGIKVVTGDYKRRNRRRRRTR